MTTSATTTHQQFFSEFSYELAGDGISISFNPDPGPPTTEGPFVLHYENNRGDAGNVTATVLFPTVVLPAGSKTPVQTELITTTDELPVAASRAGQRDQFRMTTLTGEATDPVAWPPAQEAK